MNYPDLSRLNSMTGTKVKEQCKVLFPYKALNDDELTLAEGQIVTIVTKDVEDKGWWKGEVDGKVGVFPDNFVELIESKQEAEVTPPQPPPASSKSKKPQRPPAAEAKPDKFSKPKLSGASSSFRKTSASSSETSSKSSKEKLNGGSAENVAASAASSRVASRVSAFGAGIGKKPATPSSSATVNNKDSSVGNKRHSYGKSTPPPKPKPPAPGKPSSSAKPGSPKVHKFGMKSSSASNVLPAADSDKESSSSINSRASLPARQASVDLDLDCVSKSEKPLSHPTAGRAKAPKRRPPSSVFVKDAKLNDNAFDQLKDEKTTPTIKEVSRESSQEVSSGSLFGGRLRKSSETLHKSNDSLKSADDFTSEFASLSKQRLSFKKNIQDLFGGHLSNGDSSKKSSAPQDMDASKKPPPPRPPMPSGGSQSEIIVPRAEEPKKPDWLQELKRNQQNRKSGLFQQQETRRSASPPKEKEKDSEPSPATTPEATEKPVVSVAPPPPVVEAKPVIPLKPSQIKEDARKSIQLPLASATTSSSSTTSSPSKPSVSSSFRRPAEREKEKEKESPVTASKPSFSEAPPKTAVSPIVPSKPIVLPAAKEQPRADVEGMSLEERVKRLEKLVVEMQDGFDDEVSRLTEELRAEREARRALEEELKRRQLR